MFKNLLIATALMTSVSAFAKAETHAVDAATSKITYLGTKVTGKHTGEIKVQEGSVEFDGKNFKAATVTADMTSITNTDLTDAEYNKKFIDHMKSDDFFAIEAHKTAVLKTTKVTKVKGDTYKVTADLTIKGKTAPVTFDATVTKTAANAVVNVDRTKYDIKYGSGKFFQGLGDKMINDEFQLTVNLTLK